VAHSVKAFIVALLTLTAYACGSPSTGASASAVGPVAGRPAMPVVLACQATAPLPDGVTYVVPSAICSMFTAGAPNACEAVIAVGFFGCCCFEGATRYVGVTVIPGGPADPCTLSHGIGDPPHPNCIEVPNVDAGNSTTVAQTVCGTGGNYEQGYVDGYINGVDVWRGIGTGACCCY
jgi:hypothetical protein